MKRILGFLTALLITSAVFAQTANLVITEISYNPAESGTDSTEYVELYNNGSSSVDLTGYYFSAGFVHTFPSGSIAPGGFAVVAVNASAVENRYGISGVYEWTSGGLSNGGEGITLRDNNGAVVDTLRYDDIAPWPANTDGQGASMVLCDVNADNTDGANWSTSSTAAGVTVNGNAVFGSPGAVDAGCAPQVQMDLPVTFDDPTVNYGFIDFGGNSSDIVADPTDPTNFCMETEKTPGANWWAGTTLAVLGPPDVPFANPIPFTATDTRMSVRVWAHASGIPVMLKAENNADGAIFVEAQATTVVANAWDTLIFDFGTPTNGSLNLSNVYDKVSLFYNFVDPAGAGGGEVFYWDDVEFRGGGGSGPGLSQMELPVTFDDPTVDYSTIDFGGTASNFVADPTDPTNSVVETIKGAGSQTWAGTSLASPGSPEVAFASAIPFSSSEQTMSVRLWSPVAGVPVMLKIEDQTNPGIFVEATATVAVANVWDTLFFDYSTPSAGSLNLSATYDKVALFWNFGTSGNDEIFYWDDVEFTGTGGGGTGPVLSQMELPVTFDDPTVNYSTVDFGGTASLFVADPTNASNNVVQTTKASGSQTWAGTSLAVPGSPEVGFASAIPFSATEQTMSVRVWSPVAGIPVMLKVEDQTDGAIFVEATATVAVANAWDTLFFDYSAATNGVLNLNATYDKVALFWNFGTSGNDDVFYWDDVEFRGSGGGSGPNPGAGTSPYCATSAFHFGGDPNSEVLVTIANSGPSSMIVEVESVDANDPVDVLIVAGGSGAQISAEDFSVPGKISRTLTWVTTPPDTVLMNVLWSKQSAPGNWQLTNVDAPYAFADTCGSNGGGGTGPGPVLSQMDLPVTFDDTTVDYGVIDFGGASSSFEVDPTNPSNNVVRTEKTPGANFWAGTTLTVSGNPDPGFANAIPFTANDTRMSVRMLAPAAGVTVMLKAESSADPNIFVEAQATTASTVWDTLIFDFGTPTNGVLDLANSYDKVSLFYNFVDPAGVGGGEVFYWDDVEFRGGGGSVDPCDGVTPNASILEDFECQSNINFTFANATWTEDVPNPNPTGINTSATVGEFIHWGAGTDGAFGGELALAPIDLSVSNGQILIDVHSTAAGLPIILVLQNSALADVVSATATTTVSGAWESLSYDLSAGVDSTDISNIVLVVNPGSNVQDTVYFDNFRLDTTPVVDPCAGVTPQPSIFDDFECQGNIDYTFANATWTQPVANPDPTGINTSSLVGQFIHWGAGTDGAFGGGLLLAPIDLSVLGSALKMDVHSSAAGLSIIAVLQDDQGIDIVSQTAFTSVVNEWETLSFDMSAATGPASNIVFVVSPGDTVQHVLHFDNIQLDTSVFVETCPGVTPDPDIMEDFDCQQNMTYTSVSGDLLRIANPDQSGINLSDTVGQYTRSNALVDEIQGSFDLGALDFVTHNQIQLSVWDADAPSEVNIVLRDANGVLLGSASASTSASSAWEELNFDFSLVPFTVSVEQAYIQFSPNAAADSGKVYYYDDFKIDGFATSIDDLATGQLIISPNPVSDVLSIELLESVSGNDAVVQIVSVDGQLLYSEKVAMSNTLSLDIHTWASGLYFVKYISNTADYTMPFVKQ
ncbi:MAG: lamin tail domain-containing protein [Chitinophagales bacterium]